MSFIKFMKHSMGSSYNGDGISSSVTGLARKTVFSLLTISFILFFLGALVLRFPIIVGVIVAGFLFLGGVMCLSFAIKVGLFHHKIKEQLGSHVEISDDDVIDV